MEDICVLDCTLRDGGRIIDCAFNDNEIAQISKKLSQANIDLIEMGFIRDKREYHGNTTFFTSMNQVTPFIDKTNTKVKYLVFVDFGMYDEELITPREKDGIDGIRFGFTKKNYYEQKDEIIKQVTSLKAKGYEIYLQDVNTFGYTDQELIEIIEFANQLEPVSFGIVDTYGTMDVEDLHRIFGIVNHNLNQEIAIDFHSHNNMQLSYALSQEMIRLCRDNRKLIIDATLNGMGKCAGNLNLELITSHMNRKLHYNYDFDMLLDIIDEYLYDYKQNNVWGYSIPSFMAGIYRAHPNNVIYLTEKFRLKTKDIEHIIACIDEEKRQTYDYDNIQRIYREYSAHQIDDRALVKDFKTNLSTKEVLVIVPGHSVVENQEKIQSYIQKEHPIVISVNFEAENFIVDYVFYGNVRRYEKSHIKKDKSCILTSNIKPKSENEFVFNYFDLIEAEGKYFDNSTIMLLNLLHRFGMKKITLAGFDGFSQERNAFVDDTFYENRFIDSYDIMNKELEKMLRNLAERFSKKIEVSFITPSLYQKIF